MVNIYVDYSSMNSKFDTTLINVVHAYLELLWYQGIIFELIMTRSSVINKLEALEREKGSLHMFLCSLPIC